MTPTRPPTVHRATKSQTEQSISTKHEKYYKNIDKNIHTSKAIAYYPPLCPLVLWRVCDFAKSYALGTEVGSKNFLPSFQSAKISKVQSFRIL
jgi:hypothetical protein